MPDATRKNDAAAEARRPDATVEADGQIRVSSVRAQRHLMARTGAYRLVPAAGSVVLMRRLGGALTGGPDARVVLAGEIESSGLLMEVLNLVSAQKWDGMLTVLSGQTHRSLSFSQGMVSAGSSNVPDERIGPVLFRYGKVSRQQMDRAVRLSGGERHLGQVLVEEGLLTPHELFSMLRRQVEDIFHAILTVGDGEYVFQRMAALPTKGSLRMDTQHLLFEGVRRLDEMRYFRERIPSSDMVVERREGAPNLELDATEKRVLEAVDGVRDIAGIGRECQLGEFEATKVIFHLLQGGYVRLRSPGAVVPAVRGASAEARLVDLLNGYFAKIFLSAAGKQRDQALRRDVESFFSGSTGLAGLFRDVQVREDGTLPAERVLANLAAMRADKPLDLLRQGLLELLDFLLFTAMESLDRQEERDLEQKIGELVRRSHEAATA